MTTRPFQVNHPSGELQCAEFGQQMNGTETLQCIRRFEHDGNHIFAETSWFFRKSEKYQTPDSPGH